MKSNPFTPPQQRRIRITLLQLEETLRKADRMLSDGDFEGILYSYKIHINFENQRLIHDKILETLAYIESLSKELGLKPTEYSFEKVITGELSINWESLEECRPKRMKGYGEMDPDAKDLIDPVIEELIKKVVDLDNLIHSDLQDSQ